MIFIHKFCHRFLSIFFCRHIRLYYARDEVKLKNILFLDSFNIKIFVSIVTSHDHKLKCLCCEDKSFKRSLMMKVSAQMMKSSTVRPRKRCSKIMSKFFLSFYIACQISFLRLVFFYNKIAMHFSQLLLILFLHA